MAEGWEAVLDRLESDLDAAEAQAGGDGASVEPWAVPVGLGPVPEHLQERAVALEQRQLAVTPRVEEAKASAGRHLAAVRSIPTASASGRSLYLDVRG